MRSPERDLQSAEEGSPEWDHQTEADYAPGLEAEALGRDIHTAPFVRYLPLVKHCHFLGPETGIW